MNVLLLALGAAAASFSSGLAGVWVADKLHKWWHVG